MHLAPPMSSGSGLDTAGPQWHQWHLVTTWTQQATLSWASVWDVVPVPVVTTPGRDPVSETGKLKLFSGCLSSSSWLSLVFWHTVICSYWWHWTERVRIWSSRVMVEHSGQRRQCPNQFSLHHWHIELEHLLSWYLMTRWSRMTMTLNKCQTYAISKFIYMLNKEN